MSNPEKDPARSPPDNLEIGAVMTDGSARLGDGEIEWTLKDFVRLSCRPVRLVAASAAADSTMTVENGTKVWRNAQGQRHRVDGPAVEWADDNRVWYLNGQLHRVDGPAIEWADGNRVLWYVNGQRMTEEQFNAWRAQQEATAKLERQAALDEILRHAQGTQRPLRPAPVGRIRAPSRSG